MRLAPSVAFLLGVTGSAVIAGVAGCPTDPSEAVLSTGPTAVPTTNQAPDVPSLVEPLAESRPGEHPTVIRSRTVRIRKEFISPGISAAPVVGFAPFSDVNLTLEFERFDEASSGAVWIGHVSGYAPGSTVLLVGELVTGNVRANRSMYRLKTTPSGEHRVEELNVAAFPPY